MDLKRSNEHTKTTYQPKCINLGLDFVVENSNFSPCRKYFRENLICSFIGWKIILYCNYFVNKLLNSFRTIQVI